MKQVSGKIFCPDGQFRAGTIYIEGDRIVDIKFGDVPSCESYIIPGLVDIHSHGCVGHDTCDATADELRQMLEFQRSCGVTSYCPTTMTYGQDRLESIIDNVKACGHENIKGIYMEGPFISMEKKGAQNPDYIIPPNEVMLEELLDKAGGLIKVVAIAPEVEGAVELIEKMSDRVHFSLAHTACDYDTAVSAFEAGVTQVTHLYNAMQPYTHRQPGLIGAAYDTPDVFCELIADGIHIHDAVIRNTFRQLGPERVVLISDSMEATGMPDGEYALGGQKVYKKGRKATLADGTIAGSASTLMDCLKYAISIGVPMSDAIFAATRNPAKAIGIYDDVGSIEISKKADLVNLNL